MYEGIRLDTSTLNDYLQSSAREWLETNGIGGYASSSISGANTRKYHGLLVAALQPPVGRMVLLSKLVETVITENTSYELDCNQFHGNIHPRGYQYLSAFVKDIFTEFTYQTGEIEIVKTIFMPQSCCGAT